MVTFYRLFRKDGVWNIFEIHFPMSVIPEGKTSFLILASPLAKIMTFIYLSTPLILVPYSLPFCHENSAPFM